MNDSAPWLRAEGVVAGWSRPVTPAVSFTLATGEVLGLTGPNGVGKSSLLAALVGKARLFAGGFQRRPGLRLAWQTQEAPPVKGLPLSGAELLALTGASPAGLPPWLADRLGQRLDRLSGGQRHYLALWAVLQAEADVVLLDEPTNHLDEAGVAHLAHTLRQRVAGGASVLLVSHDAPFVAAACDRVLEVRP